MKLLYSDTFEANWHDIFITRKWIGLDFNDKNQPEQLSATKDMQFHYSRDCYGIFFSNYFARSGNKLHTFRHFNASSQMSILNGNAFNHYFVASR